MGSSAGNGAGISAEWLGGARDVSAWLLWVAHFAQSASGGGGKLEKYVYGL